VLIRRIARDQPSPESLQSQPNLPTWITSLISSSLAPILFAPAKWETVQGFAVQGQHQG
jgi:hypothetical protein